MGGGDVGDPVAEGFVGGVLEGAGAAPTGITVAPSSSIRYTLSRLAAHVLRPHVHHAFEPEAGANGGGRHPVLAGPGLGDDPPLSHSEGQQGLSHRVVDLVGTGVIQVFSLEKHAGPNLALNWGASESGEGRPTNSSAGAAARTRTRVPGRVVERREILERGDQGLRHVPATVRAESACHGLLS